MKGGWIKLHRKLIDNPIWKKSNYVAVWIYLLLNANHKEKTIIWNNKKTVIKEGSFIGSIQKIAEYYGISKGTVSYILDYFISERMIEKKSTSKFTVFTIVNWAKYQIIEHESEHKLNTNRTQVEHKLKQPRMIKNNNNEKNDKKYSDIPPSLLEIKALCNERNYPDIENEAEKFFNHYESNGWMVGKTKMVNWGSALANWFKNYKQWNNGTFSKNRKNSEHYDSNNGLHSSTERKFKTAKLPTQSAGVEGKTA